MPRFFIDKSNLLNDSLKITGTDAYHIAKVLRMNVGETLVVTDNKGIDYITVINSVDKECICADIISSAKTCQEPCIDVTIFQGIPKQAKMESIIQKNIELGVRTIVPMVTSRTVVKMDSGESGKLNRWAKIAKEAAKQCQRGIIPDVNTPIKYDHAIELASKYDLSILLYEKERSTKIYQCVKNKNIKTVAILIGPEGGFSQQEVNIAVKKGVMLASLGKRILRTETASMVAIALLMHEFEEL